MVKSTTAEHLPLWKRVLEVLVVVFVFLIIVIVGFLLFRTVYEQPPEDMIKISDQFTPGRSWKLVTARIEPKRVLCVDVECPSVWKQWKTESPITKTELSNLLQMAGWHFTIDGSCGLDPKYPEDNAKVCEASGIINHYGVQVTIRGSSSNQKSLINLNISRE